MNIEHRTKNTEWRSKTLSFSIHCSKLYGYSRVFREVLRDNLKTLLFISFLLLTSTAQAQLNKIVDISGYFKELGQFSLNNDFSTLNYDNVLQNRLETKWSFSNNIEFRAALRSRLLSGYSIRHTPGVKAFYEKDSGLVDLTKVWFSSSYSLLQTQIDRFYATYYTGDFEFHAGRQRINWGRTYVWNPNDLFNNYAFLDFDYEERPGVDALLAQYNWSFSSSVQTGIRLAHSFDEMVIAGMVRTHWGTYDLQFLAGHYKKEAAIGAGWSGYIKGAGFKGELTYFQPEARLLKTSGHLTATAGFDYMLPGSVYLQSELLYNGGYRKQKTPLAELSQPPDADNLFIAKTGFYVSGRYPLTPLLSFSLAGLGSFDRPVFIIIPQLSYSLGENLDFLFLSQLLKGDAFNTILSTPNLFFVRLKWSY